MSEFISCFWCSLQDTSLANFDLPPRIHAAKFEVFVDLASNYSVELCQTDNYVSALHGEILATEWYTKRTRCGWEYVSISIYNTHIKYLDWFGYFILTAVVALIWCATSK